MREWPFSLPIFQAFADIKVDQAITFFVGENGSGKSTLLEAMALATELPAMLFDMVKRGAQFTSPRIPRSSWPFRGRVFTALIPALSPR